MSSNNKDLAKRWHQEVEGIWHGCPSVYDAEGNYLGYIQADRRIFKDENNNYMIQVETDVNIPGPMGTRLSHPLHQLHVNHLNGKRVYNGPDFYGAGYPYGSLILGNDYCIPWSSDNRVTVQLLGNSGFQAYSTVLYQGTSVHAVVNGLYKVSQDYSSNDETRNYIHRHRKEEISAGKKSPKLINPTPRILQGDLEVYDTHQNHLGTENLQLRIDPKSHFHSEEIFVSEGILNIQGKVLLDWRENAVYFNGPDIWGNGNIFGRMLSTHKYFPNQLRHIRTREFHIPENGEIAIVWEIYEADQLIHIAHGLIREEQ